MADGLQSELKNRPRPGGAQEGQRLEQLWQRLARAETAVRSLDSFLAAVREVEADSRTLQDWKLHFAAEQSERADGFLRAAGMSLAIDGVTVTCQDVVTSLSQYKASNREGEQRRSGGGSFQVGSEEGENGGLVQRRLALLVSLRETTEAAEQLRLQEPSLPALQHRYLTEE